MSQPASKMADLIIRTDSIFAIYDNITLKISCFGKQGYQLLCKVRSTNMSSKEIRNIIEDYLEAYNSFEIERMVELLHQDIIFRNISNGETTTETRGIQAFRELAEQSATMFSSRRQTITDYSVIQDKVEVGIDYEGILAVDFPNGLKSGDTLQLKGKSTFEIKQGKITLIEDYS
jgi:ketosteroid isomerase-like protein